MPVYRSVFGGRRVLERWGESMAGEVAPFGIGVTILVTGTYDTEIITDAGAIDPRDLDGPYARHHSTMDKRGPSAMTQRAAKSPDKFAAGLARALEDSAPFVRHPVGRDARMLLTPQPATAGCGHASHDAAAAGNTTIRRPSGFAGRNHGSTRPADAREREPWLTFGSRPKMMIDGKLVDGEAGTFTNINPATEEPLGEVADASKDDIHRAIDAARRAFDETDWSTNHALGNGVCCNCTTRSRPRRRSYARNSSSRSGVRARSPTAHSWTPVGRRAALSGQADRRVPMGDIAR